MKQQKAGAAQADARLVFGSGGERSAPVAGSANPNALEPF